MSVPTFTHNAVGAAVLLAADVDILSTWHVVSWPQVNNKFGLARSTGADDALITVTVSARGGDGPSKLCL